MIGAHGSMSAGHRVETMNVLLPMLPQRLKNYFVPDYIIVLRHRKNNGLVALTTL